jgi:hypothetical protein
VFCHWDSTGIRSPGTRKPPATAWPPNREERWRLPASRRSGARVGWYGKQMCTTNKRRENQPGKGAESLAPQGKWGGRGAPPAPSADEAPTGEQVVPHPASGTSAARGTPVLLLNGGKRIVRGADGRAGIGVGKSACPPVMGWIRVATSSDAQAGRLPCGVSAREKRRNRHRRCGTWRWLCSTGATCPVRESTNV